MTQIQKIFAKKVVIIQKIKLMFIKENNKKMMPMNNNIKNRYKKFKKKASIELSLQYLEQLIIIPKLIIKKIKITLKKM